MGRRPDIPAGAAGEAAADGAEAAGGPVLADHGKTLGGAVVAEMARLVPSQAGDASR